MIFKLHSAFALGLIALVAGTYLLSKVSPEKECCKKFAKFVGWFVVVTAFLGLICITYNGIMYSKGGGYEHGMMMRGKGMMMRDKGECPMMEKMEKMRKMKEHQEPEEDE
jgi:hypothetical protein